MKCVYRGYSPLVCLFGLVLFVIFVFTMRARGMNGGNVSWMPFVVVVVPVILLGRNLPCGYSADETGFTISRCGIKTHVDFSQVDDVKQEFVQSAVCNYIKLTVKGSFGEKVFREGYGKRSDNSLNDTKFGQLYGYIRQRV